MLLLKSLGNRFLKINSFSQKITENKNRRDAENAEARDKER
jgi:hypothetical protein